MIEIADLSKIKSLINIPPFSEFKEFNYRGEEGYANLVGWEIVVFSREKTTISAIKLCFNSDYEIVNNTSKDLINLLTNSYHKNVTPKNLSKFIKLIKTEENIMSNAIDYYYYFNETILIIGMFDDKIQTLEYSTDKNINKTILELIDVVI